MSDPRADRRAFLGALVGSSAALAGLTWSDVAASWQAAAPQREAAHPGFTSFTRAEAAELEAMAECILPGGERPGARQAGVIHFMDHWFAQQGKGAVADVRKGIAALGAAARRRKPGVRGFAQLAEADQVAVLEGIEKDAPAFFGGVRFATLLGMFSDPGHGGNRDKAGWTLLGFEDGYAWSAPYGAYDRG
ncbi:MAG: gluconate 2-dehydrogenase subunit 3 family protein [Gemmatimonadales bacterium]|nr:gluconate 2-dehydrogenase subunit 3 family protein [Gemmatimonadales bacterium]